VRLCARAEDNVLACVCLSGITLLCVAQGGIADEHTNKGGRARSSRSETKGGGDGDGVVDLLVFLLSLVLHRYAHVKKIQITWKKIMMKCFNVYLKKKTYSLSFLALVSLSFLYLYCLSIS